MISTFLLHASINMTTNKYRTLYSIVSRMISYNVSSNMYSPTSSSDSPNRLRITVSCLNEFLFQKSAGALTSKTTLKQQGVHCPPQKVILPQKELLLSTKNIHVFQVLAFDGICTWEIHGNTACHTTWCDIDHWLGRRACPSHANRSAPLIKHGSRLVAYEIWFTDQLQ